MEWIIHSNFFYFIESSLFKRRRTNRDKIWVSKSLYKEKVKMKYQSYIFAGENLELITNNYRIKFAPRNDWVIECQWTNYEINERKRALVELKNEEDWIGKKRFKQRVNLRSERGVIGIFLAPCQTPVGNPDANILESRPRAQRSLSRGRLVSSGALSSTGSLNAGGTGPGARWLDGWTVSRKRCER